MKILLLAGEQSGLIYSEAIASSLKLKDADCEIRGYGDYGFEISDLAVMGFWPVLKKIFYFLKVKRTMERAIDSWSPDVVCTVDYPGMNLKLSAYARERGIKTVHVVCPQVWAWKKGRIPKIERSTDKICCFFPFEPCLFSEGKAVFVGHPLCGFFDETKCRQERDPKLVALLPGSRVGEIERILPVLLETACRFPDARFEIPAANLGARLAIERVLANKSCGLDIKISSDARDLLGRAWCAAVASGTATLEAALARCPSVLVYKVGAFLAWFARKVIKGIRHVGLVNIIWEKDGGTGVSPMPELLQENLTAVNVSAKIGEWLASPCAREEAAVCLDKIIEKIGGRGNDNKAIAAIVREITGKVLV
jgi:lipid-A-disaccharide synthase